MIVFKKAEEVVTHVAQHLRESQVLCLAGQGEDRNEAAFLRSKELLTTEARQFVTASKLFVKSATESEGQLMECLNHCVHMIDRIGTITRDVALSTTTPSQTGALILKVQDVADTYLQSLQGHRQGHERPQHERADEEGHCPCRRTYHPHEVPEGFQLIDQISGNKPPQVFFGRRQNVNSYVIRYLAKHLYNTLFKL